MRVLSGYTLVLRRFRSGALPVDSTCTRNTSSTRNYFDAFNLQPVVDS